MNTNINDIEDTDEDIESDYDEILEKDDIKDRIFNFDLDNDDRLNYFNQYYTEFGDEILEIINKLNGMYLVSGTKLLHDFIELICKETFIIDNIKVEAAKCLCLYESIEDNYEILEYVIKNISNITITCHVDAILFLMDCDRFRLTCNQQICNIIDNPDLECEFRYKTILSIENRLDDKEKIEYYTVNATRCFIDNETNYTMYRILGCQLLLQCYRIDDYQRTTCEKVLSNFMNDNSLDFNLRADAADVLLRLGTETNKNLARDVIMELAKRDGPVKTIFQDAENVHHHEIEESAIEILEYLQTKYTKKSLKIDDVESDIIKYWELNNTGKFMNDINELDIVRFDDIDSIKNKYHNEFMETYKLVKVSLNRIKMDRALYGKFNCNLGSILIQVWSYIVDNGHKSELQKRMIEELVDMSGKCSSGFAYRLINTLSGFGDFNIRISWEEQISGSVSGRLNKYIMDLEDGEYKDGILNEMTLNRHDQLGERKHFFRFLRESLPDIREDIFSEYQEYMTETDFDLYFRKSMYKYEGFN